MHSNPVMLQTQSITVRMPSYPNSAVVVGGWVLEGGGGGRDTQKDAQKRT